MIRPLFLGPEQRAAADKVMAYAREHVYRPANEDPTPGDNENFVLRLGTYRCVFTFTEMPGVGTFRHLSVSVPPMGVFPNPVAMFEIARLFGFTGWEKADDPIPQDWRIHPDRVDNCVVMAQPTTL